MLEIEKITDKKQWEQFLFRQKIPMYPLFQSWNWGQVQEQLGYKIWRFGAYNGKELIGVFQITDILAKRGHYLHMRHGPVLEDYKKEYVTQILQHVANLAKSVGASFLRISPLVEESVLSKDILQKFNSISSPMHNMDAEICWVLDIQKSEDELLKDMRKTHRYLIRKAQTMEDIHIIQSQDPSDIESFLPLYTGLSERKHFIPHKGVREEFSVFAKDDEEILLLAKYENKIISGAVIAFVGNMAIYRHGASDAAFRDIPASYLIQWRAIQEAKKRGKTLYNFWGIAPPQTKNHPWEGLTLFKKGFGGEQKTYIHAQDLPLNLLYWKTYAIELITKWQKGY